MIRLCGEGDFAAILAIVNEAADAYRGVIPAERFDGPYMPPEELRSEIADGVRFWGVESGGLLIGVMGIQDVQDVTLMRHAYVRTRDRRRGLGGRLLQHLRESTTRPLLIGTWRAADWAVEFYRKHGFAPVAQDEMLPLLRRYWSIPASQAELSVVLADPAWFASR